MHIAASNESNKDFLLVGGRYRAEMSLYFVEIRLATKSGMKFRERIAGLSLLVLSRLRRNFLTGYKPSWSED